jgi:hypothetical protein
MLQVFYMDIAKVGWNVAHVVRDMLQASIQNV